MFDDPTDNTGLWTEELMVNNADFIKDTRPHLKSAINNIQTRMENRRTKVRNKDQDVTEEQLDNMTEQDLQHRHLNWFCAFCWQRYQIHQPHSAKICKQGRVLRRLATFSHHNNGEQMPQPAQGEQAILD